MNKDRQYRHSPLNMVTQVLNEVLLVGLPVHVVIRYVKDTLYVPGTVLRAGKQMEEDTISP